MQMLRGDAVVEVRDNVSSPLVLSGLDLGGPATGSRCGRATSRAAATGRRPVTPIVPSGMPGAPSNLSAQFVYDAGQRRHRRSSWGPPADPGGEPCWSYRVLRQRSASRSRPGGVDFLPGSSADAQPTGVGLGDRPEQPRRRARPRPVRSLPFSRPSQVTGLALAAGGRLAAGIVEPGQLAGQSDRSLRLPGRRRLAGPASGAGTSAHDRRSLTNGTDLHGRGAGL